MHNIAENYAQSDFSEDLKKAQAGDAHAQLNVASCYARGIHVAASPSEAKKWYEASANQDFAEAQNCLGRFCQARREYAEALRWFKKAAAAGIVDAYNNIGCMYSNGQGVTKSISDALFWIRQAAEAGHPLAQNTLGIWYGSGEGVPQDDSQAVIWFRKSSMQGNPQAHANLAVHYYRGAGVTRDVAMTYALFKIGGFFSPAVMSNLERLKSSLGPAEVKLGEAKFIELRSQIGVPTALFSQAYKDVVSYD